MFICFQTSVTIEIRYHSMDGTVGVWSDGEFLDVPDDRDGMFAFETDSLLSGQSHGSGTSPGRSLQGSIPTFRKWVKHTNLLHTSMITQLHYVTVDQPVNLTIEFDWILIQWLSTAANKICCLKYVLFFKEIINITIGAHMCEKITWMYLRWTDGSSIHTVMRLYTVQLMQHLSLLWRGTWRDPVLNNSG